MSKVPILQPCLFPLFSDTLTTESKISEAFGVLSLISTDKPTIIGNKQGLYKFNMSVISVASKYHNPFSKGVLYA